MLLYLMRHGPAGQHGDPAFPDDALRPLTDDGRRKTRMAARGLRRLGVLVDLILTSPLVRTRQTAEIIAAELRIPISQMRETRSLEPGASIEQLFVELSHENPDGSIVLVGHEPDLSGLASTLLSRKPNLLHLRFRKAAVCLIEVTEMPPARAGALRFLMQPAHLRAVGK